MTCYQALDVPRWVIGCATMVVGAGLWPVALCNRCAVCFSSATMIMAPPAGLSWDEDVNMIRVVLTQFKRTARPAMRPGQANAA